jgi:hypothetical protein
MDIDGEWKRKEEAKRAGLGMDQDPALIPIRS